MPIVYDDQIKSPNMEMEYTKEEIIELHKCSKNIFHFCKYVKIISLDKGKVTFNPYKYQKDLILQFQNNRFVVDLLCRQSGKCVSANTKIKVRSKITGEIKEVEIGNFYNDLEKSK